MKVKKKKKNNLIEEIKGTFNYAMIKNSSHYHYSLHAIIWTEKFSREQS